MSERDGSAAADGQQLAGQVALVTGAGRGIGAATARLLAEQGAVTVLAARSETELDAVAEGIRARGGQAEVVAGDLTADGFVDELFERLASRHGRLDVLVNNAGTASFAPVEEVPPSVLRDALELNTVAPYACMRRAISLMRAVGDRGCIVNIGSVEAYWTAQGESGVYPATKFALRALTLAIAKEMKGSGSGIRVGMVNPGGVDTTLVNPGGAPNPIFLDPDDVARSVLHVVTAPPAVNVFDTVVVAQPFSTW